MCELLLLKDNKKKLSFSRSAIEDAIDANQDGAGYVIFEKNPKKNTWDLKQVEHINYEKETYKSYRAPTKYYVDYNINDDGTISLEAYDGNTATYQLPKEMRSLNNRTPAEQHKAVMAWCNEKSIPLDFMGQKIEEEETGIGYTTTLSGYSENSADSVDKAIDKLYEKQKEVQTNQLMIMHFRTATSGRTTLNTQPIIYGNFLVAHNGIFTDLGNVEKSDTRVFTEKLDAEYKKHKFKTSREEEYFLNKFVETVPGWYSLFIYSWKTRKLYYYRKSASFYSAYGEHMFSTKESRFPSLHKEVNSFVL